MSDKTVESSNISNQLETMSCNCDSTNIATPIINVTPSLGSTATPYKLQVSISQRLCSKVCKENTPVFIPQFSVLSVTNVGNLQYMAQVQVQGAVDYVKCGCGCAGTKSEPINAVFSIPFTSATQPTSVTITKGNTVNAIHTTNCQICSRRFVSDSFCTLTVA
jgi:hypothetical protein